MSNKQRHTVDAYPIVVNCCAKSAACQFCVLPDGRVANARFREATRGRLTLVVEGCDQIDSLQTHALCYVTFPFEALLYNFVEAITEVCYGVSTVEVHFATPTALTVANRRQHFRVPVVHSADVQIELRLASGRRIRGAAMNVSESSVEVDIAQEDSSLPVDTEVRVELQYRDDRINVPAIVRRCMETRRALTFNLLDSPDARQSVGTLQRMVRKLEQAWLKNRLS